MTTKKPFGMTTKTTIRRAGPADLIATLWFGLGFKPRESLMLAGLEGPRRAIGVNLRVDLPGPHTPGVLLRDLARQILDPVVRSPATGVVVVVASERALDLRPPRIVPVLRREIRALDLDLFDVLGVTPTVYRSLLCRDPQCCPQQGRPIDEVLASRAAATFVLNGDSLAETEEEMLADVRPNAVPDPRVGGLTGRPGVSPEGTPPARPRDPEGNGLTRLSSDERRHWWAYWITAVEAVRGGLADPAISLSGVSRALSDPILRDAVLMHLLGADPAGLPHSFEAGYPGEAGSSVAGPSVAVPSAAGPSNSTLNEADLAVLLATAPQEELIRDGEAVLTGAARVAAPGSRAPALAVLAMMAWYVGRTARSRLLVQRARADVPEFSLARLVDDLLLAAVPPPWMKVCRGRSELDTRGPESETGLGDHARLA